MNNLTVRIHFDDIEFRCERELAWQVQKETRYMPYIATFSGYTNPQKRDSNISKIAKKKNWSLF